MEQLTEPYKEIIMRFCMVGKCKSVGPDLICTATSGLLEQRLKGQIVRTEMNFCPLTLGEANCGTTGYDL